MIISDSVCYDVWTNASPEDLTEIQLEIFRQWSVFASGGMALNGKIIKNPGGNYARSIRMESEGLNHVAVIADESIAPEAHFLEVGHDSVDMKKYLEPGKSYPLHYGGGQAARGVFGAPRVGGQYMVGFARMSARSTGWIIPAMPAYGPGLALAQAASKMASR